MVKIINSKIMKLVFISMLMLLNSNCENLSFKKDDELSLKKENYTGNQLRIDGYYYYEYMVPELLYSIYVLFNDGTLMYFGGGYNVSLDKIDEYLLNEDNIKRIKSMKDCWGLFNVDGDVIKFERWYPGQGAKKAYVRKGVILNDTTFHITKSYRGNGTELNEESILYHFRKFSPKPDSTNVFVK